MSLYHEAVQVLSTAKTNGGSIKSVVFAKKDWKTDPKTLFALTTETAKWSAVLSEVIDRSGVLKVEKQVTPELALVLTHDLLLARRGLALPAKHGLAAAISKHKARLAAELSKARIKQGFATLDDLKHHVNNSTSSALSGVNESNGASTSRHPRWIRVNAIRTTLDEQLRSTFASYTRVESLTKILQASYREKVLHLDTNISNLIAIPDSADITSSTAYKNGQLLLQDKASCFPAALLDPESREGDVIDACAAPGNKTTHLASLISSTSQGRPLQTKSRRIFACERDAHRSTTLEKMVKVAGADRIVQIKGKQDFLRLDPRSKELANVAGILLDPSCSGSGIVGRDEATLNLHLPSVDPSNGQQAHGKKRKRGGETKAEAKPVPLVNRGHDDQDEEEPDRVSAEDSSKLAARLAALSSFQLRLLEHAMAFPAAERITYSTCSLHDEENEHVVMKALLSDVAGERGWRILHRENQVSGLREWHIRGRSSAVAEGMSLVESNGKDSIDVDKVAAACIRCEKGSEDGTMGFFVAGFVRDADAGFGLSGKLRHAASRSHEEENNEEEEWDGFSDED